MFSILLPVYNNQDDVLNAIKSVMDQTYTNFELIIIDDCSTDQTLETIQTYLSDINKDNIILIQSDKNEGAFVSLNKGLQKASGKYIARIDSDDTIDKTFLEEYANTFKKNPNAKLVQAKYKRDNSHGIHGEITIVYDKSIIDEIGYYDSVRFAADTEFHMRIKKKYQDRNIVKIDKTLYFAKKRANSLTTSSVTGLQGEGLSVRRQYVSQFNNWHAKGNLYMPYPQIERVFEVHKLLLP